VGRLPFGVLPEFQRDPLGLYVRLMHQFGDIVRMRFAHRWSYAVFQPDYVGRILVDNNRNYKRNDFGNNLLKLVTGENLVTSDGEFWRKQRRLMQPAFHRKRIEGFSQMMTAAAADMLERWAQIPAGQPLYIDQEMMQVTLRVVGEALFSADLTGDAQGLGRVITAGSEYFAYRLKHVFAPPLWMPTRRNRAYKRASAAAADIVPRMIAARRQEIARHGSADQTGRAYDLMDLLLEARYEDTGEGMDDQQLTTEIQTMIGAGHETTSNTLTWTLYLLGEHPAVETKLHEELDRVLAGRLPTLADLPQLTYTQMVIEEAMRLYPAAWAIARQSIAPDQLGDYQIPAAAGITIPTYAIHRHPDFWQEPERFDPERFREEKAQERHRFAYFPFGGGPRQCIGNTFALMEARLILAMIGQRFRLRLVPGSPVIPEPLVTLRVRNGLPMTLAPR
jgi:cytochrome P450